MSDPEQLDTIARALVVRGAMPLPAWSPIPLSIRACGFPAHRLPMVFLTWLRCRRITDAAAEPVKALLVEAVFSPLLGLAGTKVATRLLHLKTVEPPHHVPVDLSELVGGVAGAE